MNCFNHHELNAVAQCQDCNKGLCGDCAKQYSMPICLTCNSTRSRSEQSRIMKELFWTFGLGLGLTYFISKDIQFGLMLFIKFYMCSGVVPGWHTLNKMTPNIFLFLSLIGWVIYFVVKLTIAICIGLVMLPIRTFSNIRRLTQISVR